jgi:RNA polymerase sigma factor (sigma-70 family)
MRPRLRLLKRTTPDAHAASGVTTAMNDHTSYNVVETLATNHRQFLSYLEKRVESREAAEDILQEAFVRGLDSPSLRSAESATAWFYRSLRNAIVDHYRRRGVEARVLDQVAKETDDKVPPESELMDVVCDCITTLLPTLKPEYARAIQRVELDDVPVRDYAAEEQMSANAAGVRVFRAREALRRRIVQSCGVCADHGCVDCRCSKAS